MVKKEKQKSERKEALIRLVVFIVSGVILYLWSYLAYAIAILNWLWALFSGERSAPLGNFIEYFNTELYRFSNYITGVSNKRPFPFTDLKKLSKFE